MKIGTSVVLLIAFALATTSCNKVAADHGHHSFKVYDNMSYRNKPNTAQEGLVASNILYERNIWKPGEEATGVLPDRQAFEALVRSNSANPGPFVLDVELLPVKGSSGHHNMETLATLADWAHEASPGKIIGYYGTNTLSQVPQADIPLARELARHVDAFFPPAYTFKDDRSYWATRAQEFAAEDRKLGPGKPVYFYLWPQYHDHTPNEFKYVDKSFWAFQLDTAYHYGDGIVLWGPSKFDWDDSTGWWDATIKFIHGLPAGAQ